MHRLVSNIIKKSQISADVQLCRNLNTVLANAEAEGRVPGSVYDVLYLENEAGYIIENLNPTTDGMYFAWDEEENQMVYLMADLETVYYPEDYTLTPGKCWITAGTAAEAEVIGNKGYNIALEQDIEEEIVLTSVVSIDTLGFKCTSVTMADGAHNVESARIIGTFGTTNITSSATSVTTSGTCTNLSVAGGASVTVGGYVSALSATSATVASTGMVSSVTSATSIVNNGVISNTGSVASSSISGSGKTGATATSGNVVEVGSKEDIESVRNQVASGLRNFEGETVKLSQDINLNGIAFMPISNYNRDDRTNTTVTDTWFQGTLDGNGYAIQNFSNDGFTVAGLNAGTNDSSVPFGASKVIYQEAVYGLFGTVYNATIKNLTLTVDIDMTLDSGNHYVGDSVGGLIGFAYGDTLTIENVTVNGSVKGYDGVGGIVGRSYVTGTITLKNVTNNATVTGVRHTGGIIGYISGSTKDYAQNESGQWVKLKDKMATDSTKYTVDDNGIRHYVADAVNSVVSKESDATCIATHNVVVKFDKVVNNGTITCLGAAEDETLEAYKSVTYYNNASGKSKSSEDKTNGFTTKVTETIPITVKNSTNGTGYYIAGAAFTGCYYSASTEKYVSNAEVNDATNKSDNHYVTSSISGFTNNGKVYIGSTACNYLTINADKAFSNPNFVNTYDGSNFSN